MAVFAAAASSGGIENSCNTDSIQCCNSVTDSNAPGIADLFGLLGVAASSITGMVGVNCSPITAIGGGGNSCTSQPVCCENNSFNGVVAIGCSPINLNL
ncbi:fungal hydrophobin [Pholiota conissans]|uniref:Hydrophobin n=1 Tax=Pholiota conissans TaxID=109636 RepID=A0A9P5YYJ3_9AGAR|nr:fungal hydrophobin [Pholiota conissans]